MSAPRPVEPGAVVMASRRCLERRSMLRPDPEVCAALRYLLAVGAARCGVEVVAVVIMSNHYHLVLHDPAGCHPAFFQWFDSLVARALNCFRGRWGSFWEGAPLNIVTLLDADAVERAVVYTMCNPVRAGLVARGREWPGVRSNPQSFVLPPEVTVKPGFFFREDGPLPAEAALVYHVPPTHGDMTAAAFAARIAARLHAEEERIRAEVAEAGRGFVGARAVLKRPWGSEATSWEARRERVPRVSGSQAACAEALLRIAWFQYWYREALGAWRAGDRDVTFPYGTWKMVVLHRARAHPPPTGPRQRAA